MSHIFYPTVFDFSQTRFLVTGGAGFIGSNLLDFLIASKSKQITVLDNLSTGKIQNIQHLLTHSSFKFIEADITSSSDCESACKGIDIIVHLAALGSVPRSIAHPLATHEANCTGFLNMLWAAKTNGIKKIIYASSSSVYGDNTASPKREGFEGNPLSPYAFTKQSNEAYAKLFGDLYGLETIGLRFFNIFGKRQNKDGEYAAFVPLAIDAANSGNTLKICGDGSQSRDFTHVSNAVWAISNAVLAEKMASGKAYNVACGNSTSLLDVVKLVERISQKNIKINFSPPRQGDIKDSLADISLSFKNLNFKSICHFEQGLIDVVVK